MSATAHPGERLRAAFEAIAAGPMAGLPVCNPALRVEVVGLAPWEGEWLGVLVLPWAMNFVILPGAGGSFRPLRVGASQEWRFPSGNYDFLGEHREGSGDYQTCAIFSPMQDFASQDEAVDVARACLDALLGAPGDPVAEARAQAEAARLSGRSALAQPVSRRAFLRGSLFGGGR